MLQNSYTHIDLSNIQNLKFSKLAKEIIKYQNFKISAALKKMELPIGIKTTTITNYFVNGRKYIKTSEKNKTIHTSLYNAIDEHLANHVQALVPSDSEHMKNKKNKNTTVSLKTQNYFKEVSNKQLTEAVKPALLIGRKIILIDNEDFSKCYRAALDEMKTKYKEIQIPVSCLEGET